MAEGVGRRLLGASLPVVAVVYAWASLEVAPKPSTFVAVTGAVLLAALPHNRRWRCVVAALVVVGVTVVTAGRTPAAVEDVLDRGLRDMDAVMPPFDALGHQDLHTLVVLAATMFGLVVAVTASSNALIAAVCTATGVCTAAAFLPSGNTVATGAVALLAALWPVFVGRLVGGRAVLSGVTALALVVVGASVGAVVGARPSEAALDWRNWTLFGQSRATRTVALVWTSDYGGIDFPAEKTTVLRITAPHRALYWRATTLDTFAGDRWVEALYTTRLVGSEGPLPVDPLLPKEAASRSGWVEQEVDVRALVDDHVVGAAQPMELAAETEHRIRYLSGGVMRTVGGEAGQIRRYTVWSYAPAPTPAELLKSPPVYPATIARYLDVGRGVVPPFGASDRDAAVSAIFSDDRYQGLWPYRPLWNEARRVSANAQSPYQATIRIERWLRSDGGFNYEEHPPYAAGLPPLLGFVQRTKLGYCQHFAGAMALMLRYLGIPARVAVGFTSGTWKDGRWTVTDHDAHAWVEAWFSGHGWLAFDPTPGRGRLSGTYTNASDSVDAIRALGSGRYLGAGIPPASESRATSQPGVAASLRSSPESRRMWLVLPVVLAAGAILFLALAKQVPRRLRARSHDPRRQASAAHAELMAFVRDQSSPARAGASTSELAPELRRLGVGSDAFVAVFERARYGPPAGARDAARATNQELRRTLSLLRARLGPGRRLRGFFALRSLRGG